MLKKSIQPSENSSKASLLVLRAARKRRAMAVGCARMINADKGIAPRLVAVK